MRLLIVRHGAPDYEKDTLTEQGWKEAELLAPFIARKNPDMICLSPLGRAQDTAKKTLELTGLTPRVFPWLCEFDRRLPGFEDSCPWHLEPMYWASDSQFLSPDWKEAAPFKGSDFLRVYEEDRVSLDSFLAEHGYVRDGVLYRITEEYYNINETVVFFCHLGRGLILLSQLLNLPWMIIAHQFWLPTSSITEVIFERSPKDRSISIARCAAVGSVPHLDSAGVERCESGFRMPLCGYTGTYDGSVQLSQ